MVSDDRSRSRGARVAWLVLGWLVVGCAGEASDGDPSSRSTEPSPSGEPSPAPPAAEPDTELVPIAAAPTPVLRAEHVTGACRPGDATLRMGAAVEPSWVELAFGEAGGVLVWEVGGAVHIADLAGDGWPRGAVRRSLDGSGAAVELSAIGDRFVLVRRSGLRQLRVDAIGPDGQPEGEVTLDAGAEVLAAAARSIGAPDAEPSLLVVTLESTPGGRRWVRHRVRVGADGRLEATERHVGALASPNAGDLDHLALARTGAPLAVAWTYRAGGDAPTFLLTPDHRPVRLTGTPDAFEVLSAARREDLAYVVVRPLDASPRAFRWSLPTAREATPEAEAPADLDEVASRAVGPALALTDARGEPVGRVSLGGLVRSHELAYSGERPMLAAVRSVSSSLPHMIRLRWLVELAPILCE